MYAVPACVYVAVGRTAIITCNHGGGAIGSNERHIWIGAGSERRRPTEPTDTVSLKHKGDSWRLGTEQRGRSGPRGERKKERERHRLVPLFAALSALLAPFLCHLTLPSSPLLAVGDLSLSSSLLWPCPLLITHSLHFCLAGIYSEMIASPPLRPSTDHLIPFLGLPFHL